MKNNKAPGEDGIWAELLIVAEEGIAEKLFTLIAKMWEEDKVSQEWSEHWSVQSLRKTADYNVRTTEEFLLNVEYKVLTTALAKR